MLNGTNGAIPGRTQRTLSGGAVTKATQRDARLVTIYLPETLDCRGCLEGTIRFEPYCFMLARCLVELNKSLPSGTISVLAKCVRKVQTFIASCVDSSNPSLSVGDDPMPPIRKAGRWPLHFLCNFLGLPQLGEACRGIIQRRPPLWEDTRGGESPCSKDPPNDCVRSM